MDGLQETKRGVGILCKCGKPGRITARGLTLGYECFQATYAAVSKRSRIVELTTIASARLRMRFDR